MYAKTAHFPKISICIPTYNRARFLEQTLKSILDQVTDQCEIVISDNCSTDGTESVVSWFADRMPRLRYVKQQTNLGLDKNVDAAVQNSTGEYCWLLGDDDILKPDAISTLLKEIDSSYSFILANGEYWNLDLSQILIRDFFQICSDRLYGAGENDRLFQELGKCMICLSCLIVRRSLWLSRDRKRLFGSMFIHVGVVLQAPLVDPAKALSKPLLRLRWGNDKEWLADAFEIFFVRWPRLVWSLELSCGTKKLHCSREPWRRFRYLLPLRATGVYSSKIFLQALLPNLRSATDRLVPLCVLLLPQMFVKGGYALYSALSGTPNALLDARIANSTLPESLHPLLGLSKDEL